MTAGGQSPPSVGGTFLGEPGQVWEGWALPGRHLPTSYGLSKGTCMPVALLRVLPDW